MREERSSGRLRNRNSSVEWREIYYGIEDEVRKERQRQRQTDRDDSGEVVPNKNLSCVVSGDWEGFECFRS
jgi:hypothetical protein